MDYTKIKASVNDQTLSVEELPKLASGGVDEVKISVEFDPMWENLEKTAVFYRKMGAVYHVDIDENNEVVVPYEVMKTKGTVYFGIFGEDGAGAVRTTEVMALNVVQGAAVENEAGYEPTPDIYAEILAAAKNAEAIAQSVRDDADAGLFGGGGAVNIPDALPNPNALVINGTEYNGSKNVEIDLMNWEGEWSAETGYNTGDVVSYIGSLYVCSDKKTPAGEIPKNSESWVYLAKQGETDLSGYYTKAQIDTMFGSYITDIDTLLGGDA